MSISSARLIALMLLLIGTSWCRAEVVIEEIRDKVVIARAKIDQEKTTLSGEITLTLTVEGPSRASVVPPRPLLLPSSAQAWRVREVALPTVESLSPERQRWRQDFRLSPFIAGPKVEIALTPLNVTAGTLPEMTITWSKGFSIQVTTTVEPDVGTLRPNTSIEAMPPPPRQPVGNSSVTRRWVIALSVVAGAIFTLSIVFMLAFRGKKIEPVIHDQAWVLSEITSLPVNNFSRLSEVLRSYIEHRFKIPVSQMTTNELLEVIDPNLRGELGTILQQGDIVKFAVNGVDTVDAGEWTNWIERAGRWVAATDQK
ncbi:MAG: hypothetical protein K8T89_21085 [Planctomycetes bacterium]|nr:hypothetical protein [Planctomycetota bacterium]